VKEYDIFLPLFYNDGTPIEDEKFRHLQTQLFRQFGGLTYFPQPNEGLWESGGVTYHDEIVIYRVIAKTARAARRFLRELKKELLLELQQEEILIVERDVRRL
jgi:hypothetical protein